MIRKFTDYAHDSYEDDETIERLMGEFDWPEEVAEKYAQHYKPLHEVAATFEYDDDANSLEVVSVEVDGKRLVPLEAVLTLLRGSDSDDRELEKWRRYVADEIENEFGKEGP